MAKRQKKQSARTPEFSTQEWSSALAGALAWELAFLIEDPCPPEVIAFASALVQLGLAFGANVDSRQAMIDGLRSLVTEQIHLKVGRTHYCVADRCPGYPYRASERQHPFDTCGDAGVVDSIAKGDA